MRIRPAELVEMFHKKYGEKYKHLDRKMIDDSIRVQYKYLRYSMLHGTLETIRLTWIGRFGPSFVRVKRKVEYLESLKELNERKIDQLNIYRKWLEKHKTWKNGRNHK